MTAPNPAATMRRAADWLRSNRGGVSTFAAALAGWLDDAANEAELVGPNAYAERVAAAILGLPDPWPDAKPPHRPVPEAVVTHVGACRSDRPHVCRASVPEH